MSDAVLFEARDDGIAILTLNRPDARNALGREIREGLAAAWTRFERDPALRVAILTGAGDKAFCAGGDLKRWSRPAWRCPHATCTRCLTTRSS
nr:enoyl-CoA hydratase-related protein [uncultured Sphingomonas sp.]